MKNKNRIFAFLLSVMMVFTYMPALAFAEGEESTDSEPVVNTEKQTEGPKWHVESPASVSYTNLDEKVTLSFEVNFDEYTEAGIDPPELSYEWHQDQFAVIEVLSTEPTLVINNPGPDEDDQGDFDYYCEVSSEDGQTAHVRMNLLYNVIASDFVFESADGTNSITIKEHHNGDYYSDVADDWVTASDENAYYFYFIGESFADGDRLITTVSGVENVYTYDSEEVNFVDEEGNYFDFDWETGQTYEHQWTVGGDNTCILKYGGIEIEVPVHIVEARNETSTNELRFTRNGEPVSFELPEDAEGEQITEENGDTWFEYYFPGYEDGDTLELTEVPDEGSPVTKYYEFRFREDLNEGVFENRDDPDDYYKLEYAYNWSNQSYENQWRLGADEADYCFYMTMIDRGSDTEIATTEVPVTIVEKAADPVEESEKYAKETLETADGEIATAKESSSSALDAANSLDEGSDQAKIDAAKETAAKAIEDAQKAVEAAQTALDAAQAYYDAAKEAYDKAESTSTAEVNDIRLSALDIAPAMMSLADADEVSARDVLNDAEAQLAAAKYNKAAASNTLANAEKAYAKIASVNTAKAIAKAEEVANDPDATEDEKAAAVKAAQDAAKEAADHAKNAETAAKETASLVEAASADENLDSSRAKDMETLVTESNNSTQETAAAKEKAEEDQKAADEILAAAEAKKKSDAAKKIADTAKAAMDEAVKVAEAAKTAADTAKTAAESAGKTPGEAAVAAAEAAVEVAEKNSAAATTLKDLADKAKKAAEDAKAAANDSAAAKAADDLAKAAEQVASDAAKAVDAAGNAVENAKKVAADAKTAAENEVKAVEAAKATQETADKSAKAVSDAKAAAEAAQKTADDAKKAADAAKTAADKSTPGTAAAVEAAKKSVEAAKKAADAADAAKKAADAYEAAAAKAKADADAAADAANATHSTSAKNKAAESVKAADQMVSEAKESAATAKIASDNAKAAVTAAEKAKSEAEEVAANTGTPEITLSATDFTYKYVVKKVKVGKKKKKQAVATTYVPTVSSVVLNGRKLSASDYDVAYSDAESSALGQYKVTVTLKGKYKGTGTAIYNINPKPAKISKPSKGKKKMTVKWKKAAKNDIKYKALDGYEIQYSLSSDFSSDDTRTITASRKARSKSIKKLQSKQTYYVRIRSYKNAGGVKLYSGWSAVKSVKVK